MLMHPERKDRGIGIVRGFTPRKDRPLYSKAVCEISGGTIHTQGGGKRTRTAYPESC